MCCTPWVETVLDNSFGVDGCRFYGDASFRIVTKLLDEFLKVGVGHVLFPSFTGVSRPGQKK